MGHQVIKKIKRLLRAAPSKEDALLATHVSAKQRKLPWMISGNISRKGAQHGFFSTRLLTFRHISPCQQLRRVKMQYAYKASHCEVQENRVVVVSTPAPLFERRTRKPTLTGIRPQVISVPLSVNRAFSGKQNVFGTKLQQWANISLQ